MLPIGILYNVTWWSMLPIDDQCFLLVYYTM